MEGSVDFSDSQLSINLHGVLGKYPFFTVMNTLHFQSERAKLKFGDTNSSDIPYICYTKLAFTIFIFFWCVTFHHCTEYQNFALISQRCVFNLVLAIKLV